MSFLRKKLVLVFLFFTAKGYAQEKVLESKQIIEAKAAYFFFTSSKMRHVYDQGGWDIQLSSSTPIGNMSKRINVNAYASIEFLRCEGRSTQEHNSTYVWELPVNVGLKPVVLISKEAQYYFAIGPRYFFIHQHNSSSYVDHNKSKNGLGLFVNTGFNFILMKHLVLDIFGEYSYAKTHFHSSKTNVYTRDIQVGGFSFGLGLGYSF